MRVNPCPERRVRFARHRGGGVASLLGFAILPVMLMAGVAVDYSQVNMVRSKLRSAADAAVLAAGSRSTLTQGDRQQIATNVARANLGPAADRYNVQVLESEPLAGDYQVKLSAVMQTSVMKIAHIDTIAVSVTSEAKTTGISADHPMEMALALDNTGSMINNMPDLKAAAKSLVKSVMDAGGSSVRVGVVPYVAAVNPGLADMSMVDTTARAAWNGTFFVDQWLAGTKGCTPSWGVGSGGGAGAGGSGDARDLIEILDPFRRIAQELFGVSAAHAADVTANTTPPYTTYNWTSPVTNKSYRIPVGFGHYSMDASSGGCDWLTNPAVVSQYELFSRVLDPSGSAVAWKGCVEARPSKKELSWLNANWGASHALTTDWDVSDAPPSADPNSQFVPYFWPDEPDYAPLTWNPVAPGPWSSATKGFHNNYLQDSLTENGTAWGNALAGWNWQDNGDNWGSAAWIHGYDRQRKAAVIRETPDSAGYTYGPNAGCPDKILRLTNVQGDVISKIDGLTFWQSGGTVISEGLTWAWRTLSPNKPFADGQAYGAPGVQKVIVLMTDGVDELIDNNGSDPSNRYSLHLSDYTAYGYLGSNRMVYGNQDSANPNGLDTFDKATSMFDDRLAAACANAKATGIKIYTVTFNHAGFLTQAQQTHAAAMLQACATKPEYSFVATDSQSLKSAFASIASSATAAPVHLVR